MTFDVFKRITTESQLSSFLELHDAVYEEHGRCVPDTIVIIDNDIKYTYAVSTIQVDRIAKHLFLKYLSSSNVGLVALNLATGELEEIIEPIYRKILYLSGDVYFAFNEVGTIDMFIQKNRILRGISRYELYKLTEEWNIMALQVGSFVTAFVISFENPTGAFIESKADFDCMFLEQLYHQGIDGVFDNIKLSDIMDIYEKIVCKLFTFGRYKSVTNL